MNKSIILQQLILPNELINYICSFVFYTLDECIEKNRKQYSRICCELKQIKITNISTWLPTIPWKFNIITIYYILPRSRQLIISNLCHRCGNYIISSNFACKCLC